MESLARFLETRIVGSGTASHVVAGVWVRRGDGSWYEHLGSAGAADLNTPFDLASVTKPFLAVAVSRLVERGALRWETQLGELLPELAGYPAETCSLEGLLSHRAGLAAHLELFRDSWAGATIASAELLQRAARTHTRAVDARALYSDLGYILAGAGLERRFDVALDWLLHDELLGPLQLEVGSARSFRKSPDFELRVAPTEDQPLRGGVLRGLVHDDNAWALSGSGLSGHAGLFGTLRGLLRFGAFLLDGAEGRGPLAAALTHLLTPRPGGSLLLGFDSSSGPGTLAGLGASARVFGHLGFTGTSLWCDPERQAVTVLLTNRVHPTRDNPRIRAARLETQQLLWQLADQP